MCAEASETRGFYINFLCAFLAKSFKKKKIIHIDYFILEASHQCQRETPKEDKILWIVLCSKHTMFEQRSNQFGVYGSLHLLCF